MRRRQKHVPRTVFMSLPLSLPLPLPLGARGRAPQVMQRPRVLHLRQHPAHTAMRGKRGQSSAVLTHPAR